MLELTIPGWGELQLDHLVCDFNGTLAVDGELPPAVARALTEVGRRLALHVLTADTFGGARAQIAKVERPVQFGEVHSAADKAAYVLQLGAARVACLGNGRNDALMLRAAALGVVVMGGEGAASEALLAADIVCRAPEEALGLFLDTRRIVATLRA